VNTGPVVVQLKSKDEALSAVKQLDKKHIGSRLVRVIATYTSGSEVDLNIKSSKK
jgi:hypothetical protein